MVKITRIAVLAGGIALSACATNQGLIHSNSGTAVFNAVDAQIVSKTATPGAPVQHPALTAAATERLLTDNVKKPRSQANVEFGQSEGGGE